MVVMIPAASVISTFTALGSETRGNPDTPSVSNKEPVLLVVGFSLGDTCPLQAAGCFTCSWWIRIGKPAGCWATKGRENEKTKRAANTGRQHKRTNDIRKKFYSIFAFRRMNHYIFAFRRMNHYIFAFRRMNHYIFAFRRMNHYIFAFRRMNEKQALKVRKGKYFIL
jgi:hypothetical protein